MREDYVLIDLFSGGGGYARGFVDTGRYRHVLGVDNYPPAARTYTVNFPSAQFIADDIKEVTGRLIRDYTGIGRGEVDVITASPPCEPFTGANPKRMRDPLDRLYRDPAGQLFLHAIRLIGELQPRVFIIENVPGIMEAPIRRSIRAELARVGYDTVYFNVLRAEEHGTPSRRIRVFVSNIRLQPARSKPPTVWEALKDLPPPGSPYPPNHEAGQIPSRHRRRLPRLRWGESLITYQGAKRRLPNYIRLHPYRIAPTVMGTSRFIHPFEDRLLTVREQARLMGFPDYHVFVGSRDAQYDMVGEAVPPPLARSIALVAAGVLDNYYSDHTRHSLEEREAR
ncbi:MAG: DNA cytosine methyltransferase [Desulfurococcales archaeon]|nr:DNA cytosine methyltransferase [Desulfurococcales archaeon]